MRITTETSREDSNVALFSRLNWKSKMMKKFKPGQSEYSYNFVGRLNFVKFYRKTNHSLFKNFVLFYFPYVFVNTKHVQLIKVD